MDHQKQFKYNWSSQEPNASLISNTSTNSGWDLNTHALTFPKLNPPEKSNLDRPISTPFNPIYYNCNKLGHVAKDYLLPRCLTDIKEIEEEEVGIESENEDA
jgi:hypothetical protein